VSAQRGNVLFIILIAVFLFASLSYAVTQSSRGGGKNLEEENRQLATSQILQFASTVQQAVLRLTLINGCNDLQISFENFEVPIYFNANAPSDKRCHVFHPSGGGVSYVKPPSGVNVNTAGASNGYVFEDHAPYYFAGQTCIAGIGKGSGPDCRQGDPSNMELMIFLPIASLDLCREINKRVGGPDMPVTDAAGWCGTASNPCYTRFYEGYSPFYGNRLPAGMPAGCARSESNWPTYIGNQYYFYHVLLAR